MQIVYYIIASKRSRCGTVNEYVLGCICGFELSNNYNLWVEWSTCRSARNTSHRIWLFLSGVLQTIWRDIVLTLIIWMRFRELSVNLIVENATMNIYFSLTYVSKVWWLWWEKCSRMSKLWPFACGLKENVAGLFEP